MTKNENRILINLKALCAKSQSNDSFDSISRVKNEIAYLNMLHFKSPELTNELDYLNYQIDEIYSERYN